MSACVGLVTGSFVMIDNYWGVLLIHIAARCTSPLGHFCRMAFMPRAK